MNRPRHTSWLVLCLFLLCVSAHAQTPCPWLTQGTAEALLGAPVITTTHTLPNNEGACTFTLQQANITYALQINVSSTNNPTCTSTTKPLIGIGNEAELCITSSRSQTIDTISSRVRDHYFTVQLTTTGKGANAIPPDKRQAILQQAAEEVAGTLY